MPVSLAPYNPNSPKFELLLHFLVDARKEGGSGKMQQQIGGGVQGKSSCLIIPV